ncbi:antirestriction protein [Plesiomonas shigelloides]|uniref:antirestriction protein n=1 Tax=Plesiomonas shigelloides TaxID=703 RepID=UPI00351CF5E6
MTHSTALKVIDYTNESTVTRLIIPEQARLDFWPQYFGAIPQWVLLEPQAFAWLDRLCDDYNGGFWDFYTLSNGGAFMAPDSDEGSEEKWSLFNPMNGNEAEVSAEAAGIIVCLLTYSHHACRTENSAMIDHYYRLREYALAHPESGQILSIID